MNLTNPMAMKGPYRELIPAPPQQVRIRLPNGAQAKKLSLLVADQTMPIEQRDGAIALTVPTILDHEVIAIDI